MYNEKVKQKKKDKRMTIKESDLYLPIKAFFIENEYNVSAEVKDVDMVITKEDERIAIELKKTFNLKLVFQAVERQRYFDSVYVAIIKPKYNKRYKEMIHLLKRLEIGLITVDFLKSGTRVHVEHHPILLNRKTDNRKKRAIIKEIKGRSGIMENIAGTTRQKRVTAYREAALYTAFALSRFNEASPKMLKDITGIDKTNQILYSNFYGWFSRVGQGRYTMTKKGFEALETYSEIVAYFKETERTKENETAE